MNEKLIAKEFIHYFCEIVRKLATQIKTNIDCKLYMTDTNPNNMFLQPVEEYEICQNNINIKHQKVCSRYRYSKRHLYVML